MATTDYMDGVKATALANDAVVGPFTLLGGKYAIFGFSSGTYSVQLQVLTGDGTNYMACSAAQTAYATHDLPAGTYKIVCGAAMGTGNVSLIRVPLRGTTG